MQWCGRHVTSATGRAQKLRHDAATLRWRNLRVVTHCAATAMRNRIGQHRFKIKQCTTTQGETDREKQSKANSLQYQIVVLRVRQHAAIAPKVGILRCARNCKQQVRHRVNNTYAMHTHSYFVTRRKPQVRIQQYRLPDKHRCRGHWQHVNQTDHGKWNDINAATSANK